METELKKDSHNLRASQQVVELGLDPMSLCPVKFVLLLSPLTYLRGSRTARGKGKQTQSMWLQKAERGVGEKPF